MKGAFASRLGLTIVCLLFGIGVMVQFRTQSRLSQTTAVDSSTNLAAMAGDLYDSNTALRQEVSQLQAQQSTEAQSYDANQATAMADELKQLRTFNGVVPVTGPGVVLTIDTALQPVDLEDLLNEFRNAGAEAIAIDGQRVVYNTAITSVGPQLYVNAQPINAPITIAATGSTEVLDRALARKGGMLGYLKTTYPNARIDLTPSDSVTLPAYQPALPIAPASS